jgi:RNA polymerase sigma-70 factor (ECF subfamily)
MTFDELCEAYYDRVVGLAVRAFGRREAEDVAHEALSRALASYDTVDRDRDVWPWLATVVRNAGRDALRRRPSVPLEEASVAGEADPAFDAAASAEERRLLARALARVPEDDREVLLMRVREGLPYADIAARTGRSAGALRVQALRARQRLAAEFARVGGTAYGIGAALSLRFARVRERVAGVAAAVPSAAQVVTAAVICGGLATGGAGPTAAGVASPGGAGVAGVAARGASGAGGAAWAAGPARRAGGMGAGREVGGAGGGVARPSGGPGPEVMDPPEPAGAPVVGAVRAPHSAGRQRREAGVATHDREVGVATDAYGAPVHAPCLPAVPSCEASR